MLLPSKVAAPDDLAELDDVWKDAPLGIARTLGLDKRSMLIVEGDDDTVGLVLPLQQFAVEIPARNRQSWMKEIMLDCDA